MLNAASVPTSWSVAAQVNEPLLGSIWFQTNG
jgi:hypothetical protein